VVTVRATVALGGKTVRAPDEPAAVDEAATARLHLAG
jgi:hypothetical protein